MARRKNSSKTGSGSQLTSEFIQAQVDDFLKRGGEIEVVKKGISGVNPHKGQKHIVISQKKE